MRKGDISAEWLTRGFALGNSCRAKSDVARSGGQARSGAPRDFPRADKDLPAIRRVGTDHAYSVAATAQGCVRRSSDRKV
jgi:hypothetical protein